MHNLSSRHGSEITYLGRILAICIRPNCQNCNPGIYFVHGNIKANFILAVFQRKLINWYPRELTKMKKKNSYRFFSLSFASGKMKIPKTTCLDAHDFSAPSAENPDALKIFFTEL